MDGAVSDLAASERTLPMSAEGGKRTLSLLPVGPFTVYRADARSTIRSPSGS